MLLYIYIKFFSSDLSVFEVYMVSMFSSSPEQTEQIGKKLGSVLKGGEVIAFFGGLGMGKTCFTRGLAEGMGLNAEVSSPTFAIVNEYRGAMPLYHFDMYRITDFDDLCSTGFFDYLDSGACLAVEWSENIENALPEDKLIKITFERGDGDDDRKITIIGDSIYENSWR